MPTMSRKDYDEMKRGSRAMHDSLQDMIRSGYTPEPLPQAAKPSVGGFLGHLKEKAWEVLDRVTRPKRLIDMGQRARAFGSSMRYLADMNKEAATDRGGLTEEKLGRIAGERRKRMEER